MGSGGFFEMSGWIQDESAKQGGTAGVIIAALVPTETVVGHGLFFCPDPTKDSSINKSIN
jgi:hypothetical protein